MTQASQLALEGLRDFSTMKWYAIPLLAIVMYIWAIEIKRCRESGDWNSVFAGLTFFGMDFFNETWNGAVFHLTQRSAVWTAPGDTALRTMVGWNLEIMFMFSIAGIIFYHTLLPNRKTKILGIPNWWFFAIVFAAFCVFVECLLNLGGHLVWEYEYWSRSFKGVWLIFFFGYFHFYVATLLVVGMKTIKSKLITIGVIYSIAIAANILFLGILDWQY